jgi:hypothetical protein
VSANKLQNKFLCLKELLSSQTPLEREREREREGGGREKREKEGGRLEGK